MFRVSVRVWVGVWGLIWLGLGFWLEYGFGVRV